MPSTSEYAALSAHIYNNQRGGGGDSLVNQLPTPQHWVDVRELGFSTGTYLNATPFSFTAGAYLNTQSGEIVIAYKGTDFLLELKRGWHTMQDLLADVGLALGAKAVGLWNMQQLIASTYFLAVKDWAVNSGHDPSKISFTGHSLGGGLASNMAVWFDRPAMTFAEAPFESSTTNTSAIRAAAFMLAAQAGSTASSAVLEEILKLTGLLVPGEYLEREAAVVNHYNRGEFLGYVRPVLDTVVGTDLAIDIGPQPLGRAMALHSMNLHAAFLYDDRLRDLVTKIPELLPALLDDKLYFADPNGVKPDFITRLVADQHARGFGSDGTLKRFTSDMEQLKATDGLVSGEHWRRALIVTAMDYYFQYDAAAAPEVLFESMSGGLHFDQSRLSAAGAKGLALLRRIVDTPDVSGGSLSALNRIMDARTWHLQVGGGSMSWQDGAGANDVAVGGSRDDVLRGGEGEDLLIGGGGADLLEGGGQNDVLAGGAGEDVYEFAGSFGDDLVSDSDGQGAIRIDGQTLEEAKLAGKANVWIARLGNGQEYNLSVLNDSSSSTGYKLLIASTTSGDEIVVSDFDVARAKAEGFLGIKLESEARIIVAQGLSGNPFKNWDFNPDTFSGDSDIQEGTGSSFTVFLNRAAKAGESLVLRLADLAGKGIKAILGDSMVDANGAVLALAEGQTKIVFGLVQDGGLDESALGSLSVELQNDEGQAAVSNAWSVELQASQVHARTFVGDYAAASVAHHGSPITRTTANNGTLTVIAAGDQKFLQDSYGNLVAGGEVVITDNTLYGTAESDLIDGKTGNDLLAGGGGDDEILGGAGDDMIGGGTGNDTIRGGEGDDFISSSANAWANNQALGPLDSWLLWGKPAAAQLVTHGAAWGVYKLNGTEYWSGVTGVIHDDGSDFVDAGAGNDEAYGGWGDDRILGGTGNDELGGLAGDDILEGGEGNDFLMGDGWLVPSMFYVGGAEHGNDFLDGGEGDDTLIGGGQSDDVFGGDGDDRLFGDVRGPSGDDDFLALQYHADDYLDGEGGDDYLEGNGASDVIYGGTGDDILWGDFRASDLEEADRAHANAWGEDTLDGEEGNDLLIGGGKDDTLFGGDGDDQMLGDEDVAELDAEYHGADCMDGGAGNDTMIGGGKDDQLFGGQGDDQMLGDSQDVDALDGIDHGVDYLDGGEGNDVIFGGGNDDTLHGGEGDDALIGDDYEDNLAGEFHGQDTLDGGEGDDEITGSGGDDTLYGGEGADKLFGDDAESRVAGEFHGADHLDGGAANDELTGGGGDDTLVGGAGADILAGDDEQERVAGEYHGADFLDGGAGDDQMAGSGGDDTLVGGSGNDLLLGDNGVALLDGEFHGSDLLDGGEGDDTLAGSGGADTLVGGTGNDILIGDDPDLDEGFHGNDVLEGGEGDDQLYGDGGDDSLSGGTGHDVLVSGHGEDYLDGGEGDDVFHVFGTFGTKTIVDVDGTDQLWIDWSLADISVNQGSYVLTNSATGQEVHIEEASDGSSPIEWVRILDESGELALWSFDQLLDTLGMSVYGTDGDDFLEGSAYVDFIAGGAGDDVYFVDDDRDTVYEAFEAEGGYDQVYASVDWSMEDTGTEALTLLGEATSGTGNDLDNLLVGNAQANVLDGRAGADEMRGGAGDDIYHADGDDVLVEAQDAGIDAILTTASRDLSLAGYEHFENVRLRESDETSPDTPWSAYDAIGNARDNRLTGNAADNLLSGGAGDDELEGRGGDDQLLGGSGADLLDGGLGNDHLDGGAGADWMVGYLGDDTYVIDDSGDVATDDWLDESGEVVAAGDGHDTVQASVSVTLGSGIEDGTLLGSADLSIMGNSQDNLLRGNDGDNLLDGGAGWDHLEGGGGNDTYRVGEGDVVVEQAGAGEDTVIASTDWVLGAHVENLTLANVHAGGHIGVGNDLANALVGNDLGVTLDGHGGDDQLVGGAADDTLRGGAGSDHLAGGSGDDLLDGGTGNDTLAGGVGDDMYRVDRETDVVVEGAAGGRDMVVSTAARFQLSAHLEVLRFQTSAHAIGYGNDQANEIYGGAGNDLLFGEAGDDLLAGGAGADAMSGGAGNDRYVVTDLGDTVSEAGGEGVDEVVSHVASFTLGDGVENLTLMHAGSGTGNGLDNILRGSSGADHLSGLDGDDQLWSGGGADVLTGGSGDDAYHLLADGSLVELVEQAGGGLDTVVLHQDEPSEGWTFELSAAEVERVDASLVRRGGAIVGNGLDNAIIGTAAGDFIEGGAGNDHVLGDPVAPDMFEGAESVAAALMDYLEGLHLDGQSPGWSQLAAHYSILAALPDDADPDAFVAVQVLDPAGWRTAWWPRAQWGGDSWGTSADFIVDADGSFRVSGEQGLEQALREWRADGQYPGFVDNLQGWGAQVVADAASPIPEGFARLSSTAWPLADHRRVVVDWPLDSLPPELLDAISQFEAGDVLHGNEGGDHLDGGAGNDQLFGGEGADVLVGGSAVSGLFHAQAHGWAPDESPLHLEVSVHATLAGGNDTLDGGAGLDQMLGGDGDDTYHVDGEYVAVPEGGVPALDLCDPRTRFGMDRGPVFAWTTDTVVELDGEGYDTVLTRASVDLAGVSVEEVRLLDDGPVLDLDARTGAGSQLLFGNAGRNRLDGGEGADVLVGGVGDDTYVVDAGDEVVEQDGEGQDTVRTALEGYVLGAGVEKLVLEGNAVTGHGNASANLLVGNGQDNLLEGGAGDDILAGWRGDDLLRGGEGDDVYLVARGHGRDVIEDLEGHGRLHFSADIASTELSYLVQGEDLVIAVAPGLGTAPAEVVLRGWMTATERITQLSFCGEPTIELVVPALAAQGQGFQPAASDWDSAAAPAAYVLPEHVVGLSASAVPIRQGFEVPATFTSGTSAASRWAVVDESFDGTGADDGSAPASTGLGIGFEASGCGEHPPVVLAGAEAVMGSWLRSQPSAFDTPVRA